MNLKIVAGTVLVAVATTLGISFLTKPEPQYGALAGPDIPSPYLQWGGVYQYSSSAEIAATSSTLCSIANPASATSTIDEASINITGNGLGNQVLYISTSTTQFGSSTPSLIPNRTITTSHVVVWKPWGIATSSIGLNPNIIATDTLIPVTAKGESTVLWGPNERLNFRLATTSPGTFSTFMTGKCKVKSTVI